MHLHVVGPAVAAHPGGVVEGGGGGDEVVALPGVELQRVRHRREGPEPDCEYAETCSRVSIVKLVEVKGTMQCSNILSF